MFGTHATDIVGYTYQADNYCPDCTGRMFRSEISSATAEQVLDFHAVVVGVNRADESSFDSGDFPKVIFGSQVESSAERCGGCGESLIGGDGDGLDDVLPCQAEDCDNDPDADGQGYDGYCSEHADQVNTTNTWC